MRRSLMLLTATGMAMTMVPLGPGAVALASEPQPARTDAPAVAPSATDPGQGSTTESSTRTPRLTQRNDRLAGPSTSRTAKEYLAAHRDVYAVDAAQLVPAGTERVPGSPVVAQRFTQQVSGLPVHGSGYVVRTVTQDGAATVIGTSGTLYSDLKVDPRPRLSAETVATRVRLNALSNGLRGTKVTVGELVVVPVGTGRLAYTVNISGRDAAQPGPAQWTALIDAGTGQTLRRWSTVQTEGPGSTRTTGTNLAGKTVSLNLTQEAEGRYTFVDTTRSMHDLSGGVIRTFDGHGQELDPEMPLAETPVVPADAASTASGAVDAQHNMGEVYDYYEKKFGRRSIDGQGGTISARVNFVFGGEPYINASWNPLTNEMIFGGGGGGYKPFSASLDVTAHEMTHGVITHTSDLTYEGQSGAMNEAYADYFGNAIQDDVEGIPMTDPRGSLLGEDLCTDKAPADCAIRDLADGHTTFRNYQGVFNDASGVHLNSTIYSGALWRVRKALGADTADRLMYATMTQYLAATSDFVTGREATLAAARDLNLSRKAVREIEAAFDASGIAKGWEKRIGMDSTTVLRNPGYFGDFLVPQPRAAGDRWVVEAFSPVTNRLDVWAGDANGHAKVLSPNDGWVNEWVETDGTSAVWRSYEPVEDGRGRVMRADMRTGALTTVFETHDVIGKVAVSGRRVAWTTVDFDTMVFQVWVKDGDAQPRLVKRDDSAFASDIALMGDRLAVTSDSGTGDGTGTTTNVVYDLARGTSVTLAAVDHSPEKEAGMRPVVLTAKRAFYAVDTDGDGHAAVVMVDRGGFGARTDLIKESATAPMFPKIDATDSALTYLDLATLGSFDEDTAPHLMQMPLRAGARAVRVTCNRGEQGAFEMIGTRGAVWMDGTTGTPQLVAITAPRGHCARR